MIVYMISISFAILVFCLVLIILSDFANRNDQVKNRLDKVQSIYQKGLIQDEEFNKPLLERFIKPLFKGIVKNVKKYIPEEKAGEVGAQNRQTSKLKEMIYHSGMKIGVNQYLKLRLLVMTLCGVAFGMIGLIMRLQLIFIIFLMMFGVYTAYVIMRFDITRRITARKNSMQRQLPEVLDMLSVSVEAGLGLEQAMIHVVDHFKGPLIDEIAVANREMAMGRNRREALILLGDRCEINEMKSFVRAIAQASQLGISIKNVLRSQATLMRQTRKNKIEEKAMKVSVKILLPMAFFIFPVLFIVLLGPAFVSIAENLL